MKLSGTMHNESSLLEELWQIEEAILTDTRLAIDWVEDGNPFHAVLQSDDGYHYVGVFGEDRLRNDWKMEAQVFHSVNGDHLVWIEWTQEDSGIGGVSIAHLLPEEDE